MKDFLNFFKNKNSDQDLFTKIDSFKDKTVMIIGDAIVDEYNYVEPLGQTGKGNILSVNHLYTEKYAGGSIAVANHLANFAEKIDLVCGIGSNDDLGNFLNNSSLPNVTCNFFKTSEYTLVKKRYIDQDLNKYFEVYSSGPSYIKEKVESQVIDFLKENLEKYDLIVVPDFGNGFITNRMAKVIQESPGFLAINTQINSGNRGYHVIGKYQKANYISINELYKLISNKLKFNKEPIYYPDRPNEVKYANCSAEKSKKILGYKKNKNIDESIDDIIKYIKNRGTRDFKYDYNLEILNDKTPVTWRKKIF